MFARSSTWSGSPEALQKWSDHAADTVRGFVPGGCPATPVSCSWSTLQAGSALTVTLWDSEAAAQATDRFAEQSRAATVEATGVELTARDEL